MPKRPRSHQLDDESQQAFRAALPKGWLFRQETPDYGIDGSVELFDSQGQTTGHRFLVQLKGTDRLSDVGRKVRIRRDTYEYYLSLDQPVLIVLFNARSGDLFARWAHSFDSYYGGITARSVTYLFGPEDKWTQDSAAEIQTALTFRRVLRAGQLPLPVGISLTSGEQESGLATEQDLRRAFLGLQSEHSGVFQLVGGTSVPLISLTLSADRAIAVVGRRYASTLHFNGEHQSGELLASNLLVLAAMSLVTAGQVALSGRLALAAAGHSSILKDPDVAFRLAMALCGDNHVPLALELAERLMSRFGPDWPAAAFLIGTFAHVSRLSPKEREFYSAFLAKRVDVSKANGDGSQAASAHYTYGNFLRSLSRWRVALQHYRLAAEFDPEYLKRPYYWVDLGGILFVARRFSWSTRAYRRALILKAAPESLALFADALLFSGQYRRALGVFRGYLAGRDDDSLWEWRLKAWLSAYLVEERRQAVQARHTREAIEMAALMDMPEKGHEEALHRALELDALCSLAWFNKGVLCHRQGRNNEAAVAFTAAAIINRTDLAAWGNALGLLISQQAHPELALLVFGAAYDAHGTEVLAQMFPGASPSLFTEFIAEFQSFAGGRTERGANPVMRLISDEGILELPIRPRDCRPDP